MALEGLPKESGSGTVEAVTNFLQHDLIKASGQEPKEWVEKHAADFREIIEANPEIIFNYQKDPEEAKKKILSELENKKTIIH